MKKLTTLLPSLILLLIFNTNSSYSQEISTEQLYESLEWKFAGPYRGGRSTAVSGVISKPYTFYMGTTGVVSGKPQTQEITGKTYQTGRLQ